MKGITLFPSEKVSHFILYEKNRTSAKNKDPETIRSFPSSEKNSKNANPIGEPTPSISKDFFFNILLNIFSNKI